jgi:hypothetical protein
MKGPVHPTRDGDGPCPFSSDAFSQSKCRDEYEQYGCFNGYFSFHTLFCFIEILFE